MSAPLAWIAGSRGGIGAACLDLLEQRGWETLGTDVPELDLSAPGADEAVVALLDGRTLTGGVHCIGRSGRALGDGPVSECTDEAWDDLLRVNLTTAFRFLRLALTHAADGASFVLIGSALATTLDRDFLTAAYRVSKAALTPLVEAAAFEGAARGIRVNLVSPGLVDTPMASRAINDPRLVARFGELMPLGGAPASPSEVAGAVAWLLSAESGRTTSATIPVDGGWSLR